LALVIELLAGVSHSVVIAPLFEAQPAELVGALSAEYVVASLILLNGLAALQIWAHLRVGQDPINICHLVRTIHLPKLEHLAVSWPMLFLTAFKTKLIATLAIHNVFIIKYSYFFCRKIAFFCEGTPPHIFVVVSKGLTVPSHVSFENGVR
jgi:hypothetical protein